jgi:predicted RNA-binding protein with PIN domain
MPYLIDGHNLIGRLPDVSLSDPDDEAQLVGRLHVWCTRRRVSATVFFDGGSAGRPASAKVGRLTVRFVRPPRTADAGMTAFLTRLGRGASQWTVVSSDRAVRDSARRLGARTTLSEEFAAGLRNPEAEAGEEKPERPSPQEISDWLTLFRRKKT